MIISEGKEIFDEGQKLRGITNLTLRIEDPLLRDGKIEKNVPFEGYGYSYGERIFGYKGIDQLKWVTEKLKKS
jgi:hypothetical protein